ncbi:hypothetical protein AN639_05080 [Candidatus Epulonipiscium fishelsonii]|uniref:Uncharacterized protein n=1 Tax=Candidatus Epulonipiscium fishelsonii TaxID=77094 RepID=A0ACC8XBK2_9FIRM|nr:hypothetical protein AN396_06875 [Epulopiscium sp. SCG-B11WGA-EpuloA1]ONI40259.1 hypothetical protein AN639_05080 [Epulopiscium sp. SCG-B05WGA-EpuloA1]
MSIKNILDTLEVLAVEGNKFYRKKDDLCTVMGAGCKYSIKLIGENKISIDSTKPLEAKYLKFISQTTKYYKYEANIKDVVKDKRYHIERLQNISDGFGVSPTDDGIFKDFVTTCMDLILPALRELLEIDDLEYIGEIVQGQYGGKNQGSKDIYLDRLLEFSSAKLGGIILEINLEMQNSRRQNEIDREIVYIGRIFGEYTPSSEKKEKRNIYNIENKKARCVWFYLMGTNKFAPPEYKGLPIVTKELVEKETQRTLDHLQIVSVYMSNYKKLRKKYKHTRKFIEFLINPNKCVMSEDTELKTLGNAFKNTIQGKGNLSMNAIEAMYEREMIEHENKELSIENKKLKEKIKHGHKELSTEIKELKEQIKLYEQQMKSNKS